MADDNFGSKLSIAFNRLIQKKYGAILPPQSIITPIGIKHLDALLGGGFSSSLPVMISSTPESGKSTVAFQFSSSFISYRPNSVAVYIDVETASNNESQFQLEDRITTLGINPEHFTYQPLVGDIPTVFNLVNELITTKTMFEEKTGQNLNLCIILDSLASLNCSKDVSAVAPKEIIGYKANELGLYIAKIKPLLAMHNITFICIDQIRSNFKLEMYARNEKTVGEFGNVKAATSVASLHHNLKQWLFLSKSETLLKTGPFGIDGWVLDCYTEKNKVVPSQFWVSVIFDKKYAIVPILSEYYFMKTLTKTEKKIYKVKKPPFPMFITEVGHSKVITLVDPTTGVVQAESQKFKEDKIIEFYNSDSQFKKIFDDAVDLSIELRINRGYFNNSYNNVYSNEEIDIQEEIIDEQIETVDDSISEITSNLI